MSIIKISKRETPFVQIDKTALQDTRLSWKAKGLLAYLLSLPNDWKLYVNELKEHATDGRDSTSKGIKELIKAGYILRYKKRTDKGHFEGYEYTVFETPQTENPQTDNPFTDKPKTGKPNTENAELLIIHNTNKEDTNKHNTNINKNSVDKSPLPSSKKEIKPKIKKEAATTSKGETLTNHSDNVFKFKVVMQYLIEKTGKQFKIADTEAKIKRSDKFKKINARLVDGYAVNDFKAVIDTKCREWLESPKMSKYLQPSTLFCLKNFEKYLDESQNTINHEKAQPQQQARTHRNGARTSQKFRDGVDNFLKSYSQAISFKNVDLDEPATD